MDLLATAFDCVTKPSQSLDSAKTTVRGFGEYESKDEISVNDLFSSYATSGFQAANLGRAQQIILEMLNWRLSHEEYTQEDAEEDDEDRPDEFCWKKPAVRRITRARIFLSFTSNLMSSGLRESFLMLAKNRLIDVLVTTAGGIEEDFIKCMGSFVPAGEAEQPAKELSGKELRSRGWNRIGNIYVPNENYCKFERWFQPLLEDAVKEKRIWSPSELISKMGKAINNETSVYYWCWKNKIPVFCPSFTDGAIGDNIFFFNGSRSCAHDQPELVIDVASDIGRISRLAIASKKTGCIILGGGSAKHHVLNANMMRNGTDFAVYINTAAEFDGSDSGASVDEAVSWGKVRSIAPNVKVNCDATIAFPLLVATAFNRVFKERELQNDEPQLAKWMGNGVRYILEHPVRVESLEGTGWD